MKKMIDNNRSNPILDSITHIEGYPNKLIIYKITASKYWWVRCYFNKKYYKQSTTTENKVQAKSFAIKFYEHIVLSSKNLIPRTNLITFENVARQYLQETREQIFSNKKHQERIERQVREEYNKLIKDIFPLLGQKLIRSITFKDINEYMNEISRRELSASTKKHHLVLIRKVFRYGQRENIVELIPPMPTIKIHDNPRSWFNFKQYGILKKITKDLIKKEESVRGHQITNEMRFLITFNVNTFLRISDIKLLKHRHIEIVEDIDVYLRIQPEVSKTYNFAVTSMKVAVYIYKDLLEFHERNGNPHSQDDYVFFPNIKNRNHALSVMRRLFERILEVSDLKITADGQLRTLYSLRHSSIAFRLIRSDIDVVTLARNARTSVSMIERFYTKYVTTEETVRKIQSNRR